MSDLTLYTHYRSSAAFRVRIALNLKGLAYESRFVHLLHDGGEHLQPEYLELNPQGMVPTMLDGLRVFTQSMAIVEYLDELYPGPPLLPPTARDRAQVRALAKIIASDIHPLNNLRVLNYLKEQFGVDEDQQFAWYRHWIHEGFRAFEVRLVKNVATGSYCFGDAPTLADICLVPQVFNARRYQCKLDDYPTLMQIYERCMELEAFQQAAPEQQPDAK